MRISIFGLGYVGCISAGCLAQNGHSVIGVDVDPHKVQLIDNGKATIIEKDIDSLIEDNKALGRLSATCDVSHAVKNTDVSIICVGTPVGDNGQLNLDYIYRVSEQIGEALREKTDFHIVVIRSTVKPGTNKEVSSIIESSSGKIRNTNFAIVSNPEFLREGSAVNDYYNPPYTLIGSDNEQALNIMEQIYKDINTPIYRTDLQVAEIIKYVNNSFHALKITFANEIGNICKNLNIDSQKVMELLCKDHKLNISPYYLKPGMAYGGSCLPKDLKALVSLSKDSNIEVPVLNNVERSNEFHKEKVLREIIKLDKKHIGILGLSFKAGTDDLRESPMVDLAERLIGKGFDVKIYDNNVELSRLIGTNKSYIEKKLPHLANLLTDLNETVTKSDILILANKDIDINQVEQVKNDNNHDHLTRSNVEILEKTNMEDKVLIDLIGVDEFSDFKGKYTGICW